MWPIFFFTFAFQAQPMNFPKLSLTGDLGSGKSRVSGLLSEALHCRIVSTGYIQRRIAEKYGMTTLELNEYTKTHPEIDDEIDGTVTEMAALPETLIFDSRLAWHFAPDTFKVFLLVDSWVAADRILNDHRSSEPYADVHEAHEKIMARRQSELERFKAYYHINYADLGNYDLVVETTHATPDEIAACILDCFDAWQAGRPYAACWLSPRSLLPTKLICCSLEKDMNDADIMEYERNFLILEGHGVVSKALAEDRSLLPLKLRTTDPGGVLERLRKNYVTQWEEMHFVKFREIPDIYR